MRQRIPGERRLLPHRDGETRFNKFVAKESAKNSAAAPM